MAGADRHRMFRQHPRDGVALGTDQILDSHLNRHRFAVVARGLPGGLGESGMRAFDDERVVFSNVVDGMADGEARLTSQLGVEEDVVLRTSPDVVEETMCRRQPAGTDKPVVRTRSNLGYKNVVERTLVDPGSRHGLVDP